MIVVSLPLPHNPQIRKPTKTRAKAHPSISLKANSPAQATDLRLGRILRLLMEHATVVVSGTKIAQEISSNRSEVWRLIQQLRGLGVDVAGHPATGYLLQSVPDLLLPEILAPLVRGTIFHAHLHHFYKIASTNTSAMQAAADAAPEGTAFLAEEQTAGRGRGGHTWQSPPSSGIYCSVILRPALPPSDVLVLALAAGLAVRAAMQQVNPDVVVDLKWPNDALIGNKKVCGILAEMNAEPTRVRYLVIGIGINVNQTAFPKELSSEATSLQLETGSQWSRVELAAALLKSLDREYRDLLAHPDARQSILRRFSECSSWIQGKSVRIEENGLKLEGITEGLDDRGFLKIRTASGPHTVLSGTIRAR